MKISAGLMIAGFLFCAAFLSAERSLQAVAQVKSHDGYYEVILNYESGAGPYQIGAEYARAALKQVPQLEALLDTYLDSRLSEAGSMKQSLYLLFLSRAAELKNSLPENARGEIEGFASVLSGQINKSGDKKLSKDEFYLLNLLPDVARGTQCFSFGVWGKRSASQSTLVARLLDWPDSEQKALSKIQAVTRFKNGGRSILTVGYLGYFGVITGLGSKGVFGAIHDSSMGRAYPQSLKGYRSYPFDLRSALEDAGSVAAVADIMGSPRYAFNHLIILADKERAGILENCTEQKQRTLRTDSSELHPGVTWKLNHAVAAANSFMLKTSPDNHTDGTFDSARIQTAGDFFEQNAQPLTLNEMKILAGTHAKGRFDRSKGDLFNRQTQQIVVYDFASKTLEVFFHPKGKAQVQKPVFVKIESGF